jgi:hypothetical protein
VRITEALSSYSIVPMIKETPLQDCNQRKSVSLVAETPFISRRSLESGECSLALLSWFPLSINIILSLILATRPLNFVSETPMRDTDVKLRKSPRLLSQDLVQDLVGTKATSRYVHNFKD